MACLGVCYKWNMTLPAWLSRDRLAVLAALGAPLAVCAALSLVRDSFANTDAALVLVLVVVAVAADGFRLAGILAAVSAAVWFDFFLTAPYNTFAINDREDVETAVLLLAVGVVVTELAIWGRRKATVASEQAGYLVGIRAATELVSSGASATTLAKDVASQLMGILGLAECHFERGAAGIGHPARLRHDGTVEWQHQLWDVDKQGLPVDVEIELLVESAGKLKGRYMMRAAASSHPSIARRLVAVTLANQVGAAL